MVREFFLPGTQCQNERVPRVEVLQPLQEFGVLVSQDFLETVA